MTTVAAAFAQVLREAQILRVYGLPGEDHLRLLDALPNAGLAYVAARDESAAAIMAATEAEATGVPGVVVVTLAPGITNAINGIAHAAMDGVPLLVVSGQHHPERAPLIVRQSLDTRQLVSSLCKATFTASARIHQVMARALAVALAPPAGPVFLELRDDVAAVLSLDTPQAWRLDTSHPRGRVSVPQSALARIDVARRPCIVVGGGCPTGAQETLATLSSQLRAPVFTSPSAMGMLGPEHAWFAGTFMNGNFEAEVLDKSDLVVTVGLDAKDFFNAPWRYSAQVLAINEQEDTQRFIPLCEQLVGHTAGILEALGCATCCSEWIPSDIAEYRESLERPFGLHENGLTIPAALRLARQILPPETLIAVDAGFGKPLASYLWSAPAPKRYFTAHALSTMGYAAPAANALKLVEPQAPVVAFMGDGSLLMRVSEVTVAMEQGSAPIYVAWMDGALAQIETKQVRQRLETVGARVPKLSCARIAAGFDANGCDVKSLTEFEAALQAGLHAERPTLIGAYVDQSRRAEWFELMRG